MPVNVTSQLSSNLIEAKSQDLNASLPTLKVDVFENRMSFVGDVLLNAQSPIVYDEFLPKLKGAETFVNLKEMLPEFISNDLEEAIEYFGTKIKGFNSDFAILAGVESRTSSPVKIVRDDNFMTNIKGIYAIGEGSGYAGGITTSAIDGIKMAEIFAKKYKNN